MRGQQQQVVSALGEPGQRDRHDRQPVIEVLAEATFPDQRGHVAVRGGDDSHVHRNRHRASDALDLVLLQRAQDLALQRKTHVADLVEQQRAAVRALEAPDLASGRAGERSSFVTEELAFEQVLGDRGAVERDEGSCAARTLLVDRARDQLLAGSRLTQDQDAGGGRRNLSDPAAHAEHRWALRDERVRTDLDRVRVG